MTQISVIMPVYNGERYIKEAVESVLAQTLNDWELIIIDDGSTDATLEKLNHFTNPRIYIIQQPNQGASIARNAGLAQARGDYIAFLDADDIYLPNALQEYVNYLETHPEHDVVYADGWISDSQKQPLMRISEHRSGIYTGHILERLVLCADIGFPVCTLTRHEIIKTHQVTFDPKLRIGEDWDFWIYLARWAQFGYLDKPLCLYRVHSNSVTHSQLELRARMIKRMFFKITGVWRK